MFSNVDYSNSEYVTFTLGNGTEIKVPTLSAFEALKTLVNRINSNVEALQTVVNALESNDYVTGVTPLYDGTEEIGYKINFSKSGSVTIYHGKDGNDGAAGAPGQNGANGNNGTDGKDGVTPVIGVAQENGIYYWTVNGSWLLDESGNKVPTTGNDGAPGQDGENGANGTNGKDGQDGITPQLKIENGKWFVSYDKGISWTELGQATGDQGPQGPQGTEGCSFFLDIQTTIEYVEFTFANGEAVRVPTWEAHESLILSFSELRDHVDALQRLVGASGSGDYIVSVTPFYEAGKEAGYIIEFANSGRITIHHGKNGANGTTPIIGVAKDADNVYCWTVNGSWLLNDDGEKMPVSGEDGATPQFKIENGKWFISYNDGTSWTELEQTSGDSGSQGSSGSAGQNGNSFFQSVTETNEYVSMVLTNGTEIRIPKYSAPAATIAMDKLTGFTATFNGTVVRHTKDLKVTVYYGTTENITVYKHLGKVSATEFDGDEFTLRLTGPAANTTYYYFTEIISEGKATFSDVDTFRTGEVDSYVDWGDGENLGGSI